jgi:hypothetical protein
MKGGSSPPSRVKSSYPAGIFYWIAILNPTVLAGGEESLGETTSEEGFFRPQDKKSGLQNDIPRVLHCFRIGSVGGSRG